MTPLRQFIAESGLPEAEVVRVWEAVSELSEAMDGATDRQVFAAVKKQIPRATGVDPKLVDAVVRWMLDMPAKG